MPITKSANTVEEHWTARSSDDFAHAIAFDFIAQLEQWLATNDISQVSVAKRLGVTKSAVSKVMNNPQNLTLGTIAKYSRALGLKTAIVAYQHSGGQGLIPGAIFGGCWQAMGRPEDTWALDEAKTKVAATTDICHTGLLPEIQVSGAQNGGGLWPSISGMKATSTATAGANA